MAALFFFGEKFIMKLSDINTRKEFIKVLHTRKIIDENKPSVELQDKFIVTSLLNNSDTHYHIESIPKKHSDGKRELTIPDNNLKKIQRVINNLISEQLKFDEHEFKKSSQAFQKGKSIFSNAQIHRNKKYILHVDIENFFPSIHFGRISGYFIKEFKMSPEMAYFFSDLLTYKGSLPQGAPTSPIIANLIGEKLDKRIQYIASKYHFTYSRYADDLVFSTNDESVIMNKLDLFYSNIENVINKNGFSINEQKLSLNGPNVRHTVTGLSNNKRVSSTVDFYKSTRAMANSFYTKNFFEINNNSFKGDTKENFEKCMNILQGRFSFIKDIEDRNRALYFTHANGEVYHGITANDFREIHYTERNNKYEIYSGKILSYSRFLFFKFFLAGDVMHVFTEGKTDPRYIRGAITSLNSRLELKLIDFQTQVDKGTTFSKIFDLNRGGHALSEIIHMYCGDGLKAVVYTKQLTNYGSYFKKRLISKRASVMLLDFELRNEASPLVILIGNITKMEIKEEDYPDKKERAKQRKIRKSIIINELKKNGYFHVTLNLYLATTIKMSDTEKDNAIEGYFAEDFLENPLKDGRSFEEASSLEDRKGETNKNTIRKEELSRFVEKIKDEKTFDGFKGLLDIFKEIQYDYEKNRNEYSLENKN